MASTETALEVLKDLEPIVEKWKQRKLENKRAARNARTARSFEDWRGSYQRAVEAAARFIQGYQWPTIADLQTLQAQGGNPYFQFWEQYYGSYDRWGSIRHIPPGFSDQEKLRKVLSSPISSEHWIEANIGTSMARRYATSFFGWAVPTASAIYDIAKLGVPIVDYGAGRGYWAWMLRRYGATVVPYEPGQYEFSWTPTTNKLPSGWRRRYAAMFVWPTYDDPWAAMRLRDYRGDAVIYVGEGDGGCTADERFHRLLSRYYKRESVASIPQWYGIHDEMEIWRR